ncbi:hypothetical protein [Peptoniphilus raoultii]|uniref:hypothetical protein n=1 Tax=Peptoniphilus raoultii TaxID=1776387 RepID=UPI0008DAB3B5|nr:hypothetical protein [Peptoniphilus raoultii]
MFFFTYKNNILEASSFIQIGPLDFLIYVENKNLIIDSCALNNEDFRRLVNLNQKNSLLSEKLKGLSYIDYKNLRLDNLDFMELVNIYRETFKDKTYKTHSFKEKLVKTMEKVLENYRTGGKKTDVYSFKALVRRALCTDIKGEDEGIENLINEYLLFLKIKAYESMSLYELLNERDRFFNVLVGTSDIKDLGFPKVDFDTLKNRIYPALKILIRFKEDIYLLELFNFFRDYELQNPFTICEREYKNRRRGDFVYLDNAILAYNYEFFEKLGLSTNFFIDEVKDLFPWQFQFITEYLYGLVAKSIRNVKYTVNFYEKLNTVSRLYGNIPFIKYFLDYVKGIIKI